VPQRGDKVRLIELASQNARHLLEERTILAQDASMRADDTLYEVQEALDMKVVPRLAVCFDISHTQGDEVVGSAIVFRNGEPDKSEYRKFRIKGQWGNDDVASMEEVVERYIRRRMTEGRPLPELALIDGGRGQLGAAVRAAVACGATDMTFASLAKREEDVYLTGRPDPLRIAKTSRALRLLQRMRDEAHRFAHSFNRARRQKKVLSSELTDIPGIGPARRQALIARFGSLRTLREASVEEIARVPGLSLGLADSVHRYLAGS